MSWQRIAIYGLGGVVVLQLLIAVAVWMYRQSNAPLIGVFDAERAVNDFVGWSENRLSDGEFKGLLAEFERQVDMAIVGYGQGHDLVILRSEAVLSGANARIVDVTDAVMQEVLQ